MKIISLSISRVVATLGIVLCHILCYYTFIPGHSILGHFFNVGVPMFIIISGYLYGGRPAGLGGGTLRFYLARLLKVSLPIQIYAIALLIVLGFSELKHTTVTLVNLQGLNSIYPVGELFDAGPNLSHTWFVTIIIVCYLLLPPLSRIVEGITTKHIILMWICVLVLPFLGITLQYIALFVTSYFVAYKKSLKDYNIWLPLIAIVLALAFRIAGHRYFDDTVLYTDIIVTISHFIMAAAIMLLIKKWSLRYHEAAEKVVSNRTFKFLEKYSFYIYITHYCLIIPIYHQYGIGVATLLFLAGTFVLTLLLGRVHMFIEGKLKKILFKQA